MTNEEAVKMLRTMQRTVYLGNRKFEDAIECAIKALSEPLQPWEVLAAQSVLSQPEPHWIPVTERLPEVNGCYLVSVKNDHERRYSKTAWFEKDAWFARQDVLAWMPLPEPAKLEKKGARHETNNQH